MEHIFTAVQDRLTAKVEELKWVDYDFGQLDVYHMRPPVQFPCALIDIELPETRERGERMQQCRVALIVRIAFEQPGQTNNKTPELVKEKALSIFNILKKIHAALHGYDSAEFGKIVRRSLTTERREDPLKVFNMRFETSYTETIPKEWVETVVAPVIEMRVED
jgi:hypothetical protein